jgi:hypothetical protein
MKNGRRPHEEKSPTPMGHRPEVSYPQSPTPDHEEKSR